MLPRGWLRNEDPYEIAMDTLEQITRSDGDAETLRDLARDGADEARREERYRAKREKQTAEVRR